MLLFVENLEEQRCVAIWDLVIFIWKGISASSISDRGLILIIYSKLKKKNTDKETMRPLKSGLGQDRLCTKRPYLEKQIKN